MIIIFVYRPFFKNHRCVNKHIFSTKKTYLQKLSKLTCSIIQNIHITQQFHKNNKFFMKTLIALKANIKAS